MTTGQPLVSIGLPVYNGADHLARALESVLTQDYANLEVIVSDNASDDGTEAIARRFADGDARVRYLRNAENVGFLPNFRRVLDEARGTYFSWLAHDDLLSDASYIGALVRYLEAHRDVVACTSAFYLLDNELPGSVEVKDFPEIAPERWPRARRALFRWPHGWLDAVIYGIFRRDELTRIRIPERTYKGRPYIFCWEMDVLTALSGRGSIVALPECLRSYRLSAASVGLQISGDVSSYDLLVLGLRMKSTLLRRAFGLPIPWRERIGVIGTSFANVVRANFRQPYDLRVVLKERERELARLHATARERDRLIDFMQGEIEARKAIALEQRLVTPSSPPPAGAEEEARVVDLGDRPAVPDHLLAKRRRGALVDFFSPLEDWQVERLNELNEHIGILRRYCVAQLPAIERLQVAADAWLKVIE